MAKHRYYLEDGMGIISIQTRKTKPTMGKVITADGEKWQVWYIEWMGDDCNARCERVK